MRSVHKKLSRLSFRCRAALTVLALVLVSGELLVHGLLAKKYYDLNLEILRLAAVAAVKTGAQYLPSYPNAAVREADAYAEGHGIARAEIIFTKVSSDNSVLTIQLVRKLPRYLAVLALGRLPTRQIEVTASAHQQRKTIAHSIMFIDRSSSHFYILGGSPEFGSNQGYLCLIRGAAQNAGSR